jgi:hypothetical protein
MTTNQNHKYLPLSERPPRRKAWHKEETNYYTGGKRRVWFL